MCTHSWDGHQYFTTEEGGSRTMQMRRDNEAKMLSRLRRRGREAQKQRHREKSQNCFRFKNSTLDLSIKNGHLGKENKKSNPRVSSGFHCPVITFYTLKLPLQRQCQSHQGWWLLKGWPRDESQQRPNAGSHINLVTEIAPGLFLPNWFSHSQHYLYFALRNYGGF